MSTIFTTTINYNNAASSTELEPKHAASLGCKDKLMVGNLVISRPAMNPQEITNGQIAITNNGDNSSTVQATFTTVGSDSDYVAYLPGGKNVSNSVAITSLSTTLKPDNIKAGETVFGVTGTAYSDVPEYLMDGTMFITIPSDKIWVGVEPSQNIGDLMEHEYTIGNSDTSWSTYASNNADFSISEDYVMYETSGGTKYLMYGGLTVSPGDTVVPGGYYYYSTTL